jgi:hypothetical protein
MSWRGGYIEISSEVNRIGEDCILPGVPSAASCDRRK